MHLFSSFQSGILPIATRSSKTRITWHGWTGSSDVSTRWLITTFLTVPTWGSSPNKRQDSTTPCSPHAQLPTTVSAPENCDISCLLIHTYNECFSICDTLGHDFTGPQWFNWYMKLGITLLISASVKAKWQPAKIIIWMSFERWFDLTKLNHFNDNMEMIPMKPIVLNDVVVPFADMYGLSGSPSGSRSLSPRAMPLDLENGTAIKMYHLVRISSLSSFEYI